MNDYSINLRPFFEIPLRWWRFIFTTTALLTIFAIMVNLLPDSITDLYRAKASVAIIKSRTQVSFDSSVRTVTEEDLIAGLSGNIAAVIENNNKSRRETLVALVQNGTIAERVLDRLQDELPKSDLNSGSLIKRVSGTIAAGGDSDLIEISVTHPDPVLAARMANVWAEEYEQLVNNIYGRPASTTDAVQNDVLRAKQVYDDAQEALIQAIAQSRVSQAEREISEKTRILAVLQESRQRAISTTINFQVDRDAELYTEYLASRSANRLLAFQKEQARKRSLMEAYIDTQTSAQITAYTQQVADRRRILEDAYNRKARIEGLLERARTMQQQAQQGGDAESSALAVAFLKMDVAGVLGRADVSELNIANPAELAPANFVADMNAMVSALEQQLAATESQIATQSEVLINDENLTLFTPPDETELTALIAQRYPELFETGSLAELSIAALEDDELSQAALRIADDLLQLRERQGLLSFTSANTPLNTAISNLEQELRNLRSAVERDQGNIRDLQRARDLAFEAYATLSRKSAEINVADQLPGSEVRFASRATVPTRPTNSNELVLNVALFAVLGVLAGLLGAVVLEFAQPGSIPQRVFGKPERAWNRFWRWYVKPSPAIRSQREQAQLRQAAAAQQAYQAYQQAAAAPSDPSDPPTNEQKV